MPTGSAAETISLDEARGLLDSMVEKQYHNFCENVCLKAGGPLCPRYNERLPEKGYCPSFAGSQDRYLAYLARLRSPRGRVFTEAGRYL